MPLKDLGPMPPPSTDTAEPQPGGPDAADDEPTGLVRDIRASIPGAAPVAPSSSSAD